MEHQSRHTQQRYPNRGRDDTPAIPLNLKPIDFANKSIDLFDGIASATAECIAQYEDGNKSSQLRKYYDEILMWDQKIRQNSDSYVEYLPLIKMLNAKVAYAHGRGGKKPLVDKNFVDLMRHCLGQLTEDKKTFETCKLFFEAFMGFYKVHKPQ
jgi:CRISPR-associated protein Csm2